MPQNDFPLYFSPAFSHYVVLNGRAAYSSTGLSMYRRIGSLDNVAARSWICTNQNTRATGGASDIVVHHRPTQAI